MNEIPVKRLLRMENKIRILCEINIIISVINMSSLCTENYLKRIIRGEDERMIVNKGSS